jgi:hypothetical protein
VRYTKIVRNGSGIPPEVREAQSREIVAQVLDATDFAGKWVIGNDTAMDKLETLPAQIATTKQHLASL